MTREQFPHNIVQSPSPGTVLLKHQGELITFSLYVPEGAAGSAALRTNLGNARVRREEIIRHVEDGRAMLGRDWLDVPMRRVDATRFEIALPLHEIGSYQAKALFLPDGVTEPVWPPGENACIKVEPAHYASGCSVYTAFTRQFRVPAHAPAEDDSRSSILAGLDHDGYSVIPPSGTFRQLAAALDHIMDTLGFRIIQLLPVFPCPTTYARMGRFGSPFAALDYMDVDPSLAEFDRRTTPLDQFRELVDAVHARSGRLVLDVPINHTGWASWLQVHHPDWFVRTKDRTFRSPGAWGVTWEDLSELDYGHRDLWRYMADVFFFWCEQGVDGFRCDAGYMVPRPVWRYIVARVRDAFPETLFLLEGLGGSIETTETLLLDAGLNWAYSELFQDFDRGAVEHCLRQSARISSSRGIMVHFAETHDNLRLAATSAAHARMRTALAALCSHNGAFGITNGVEWFADENVDVHGAPSLSWGQTPNQVPELSRLNRILTSHPAFHAGAELALVHTEGTGNGIALRRRDASGAHALFVLVNLDSRQPTDVCWPLEPPFSECTVDLLTGHELTLHPADGRAQVRLEAGQVLCLAPATDRDATVPAPEHRLRARAKVMEILAASNAHFPRDDDDIERLFRELLGSPEGFVTNLSGPAAYPPVARWNWPSDLKRVVMVPPEHLLLITCPRPFTADLRDAGRTRVRENSLQVEDGPHFVLVAPRPIPPLSARMALRLALRGDGTCQHATGTVLYLARGENATVPLRKTRRELSAGEAYGLCTNGRGALSQMRAKWGSLASRYDAILAANLHPDYPVDRQVLLRRCRLWLVFKGYSQDVGPDCLDQFEADAEGGLAWRMTVPIGMGKTVCLRIRSALADGRNEVEIAIHRELAVHGEERLQDDTPVRLIVRPDVEDRNFHAVTKAYSGPEEAWPRAVRPHENGFVFQPSDTHALHLSMNGARFVSEPEWTYMVHHGVEAQRGLDPHGDVFSPGYLECRLLGGERTALLARAVPRDGAPSVDADAVTSPSASVTADRTDTGSLALREAARRAIRHYLVKRDDSLSVIAGYPWFLDWGRDTLICLRGLIAAGLHGEALDILTQFGRLEREGTLPNMIRGADDSNRDTSDAPLWFFVGCADLLRATGDSGLLETDCAGRPLREVLRSIVSHYREGTPNGIRMDPESGLVFSPSHFTWMDTNHPAGTPRRGYPVEIQALWHHALSFLAEADSDDELRELAGRVRASLPRLYAIPDGGYLADCLHAEAPGNAAEAEADDALRPNQLLAVTLGAVSRKDVRARVLRATSELLVPGAIRSLADRRVSRELPVIRDGVLLNDPSHPYWGSYVGDEDTRRKPAYHNGTAWTWIFPSYSEALYQTYGAASADAARAILASSAELLGEGCVGHVPEILDGDAPHRQRGCGAQAWGVTELYRVLRLLDGT